MENSHIEWTDHSFNPWIGCQRVSPGCVNCYAETRDNRFHGGDHWGPRGTREITSDANWRKPISWNKKAAAAGVPAKVFCASLADVFEDRPELHAPRARLFCLIQETPWLIWQLLTKRPENVMAMVPENWQAGLPSNVWIGTSVEDQRRADERIPHLLKIPADVRFLSCEPLLGPVDFTPPEFRGTNVNKHDWLQDLDWVIVGGESGPNARPMHPDWARGIRDACRYRTDMGRPWSLPFLFKQWGAYGPWLNEAHFTHCGEEKHAHAWLVASGEGGTCYVVDDDGSWSNWSGKPPFDSAGECTDPSLVVMGRFGKKDAGREFDGRTWDEMPQVVGVF